MKTFDEIPVHSDSEKWNDENPFIPGKEIEREMGPPFTVKRSKCISAFWFTKEVLMKGDIFDPQLIMAQHPLCGTVLYVAEPEK